VNFFCVAAALRESATGLVCAAAQFRRFRSRPAPECGLGNIDNPIFFSAYSPSEDQFTDNRRRPIPARAASYFSAAVFLAEPAHCSAPDTSVARPDRGGVTLALEQLFDLAPAAEPAERVEVLQERARRLTSAFLEWKWCVERFFEIRFFPF